MSQMKMVKTPVITMIKPYTIRELYTLYGISDKTMRKWLEPFQGELGQRQGHLYNVRQVEIIFQKLGVPVTIT